MPEHVFHSQTDAALPLQSIPFDSTHPSFHHRPTDQTIKSIAQLQPLVPITSLSSLDTIIHNRIPTAILPAIQLNNMPLNSPPINPHMRPTAPLNPAQPTILQHVLEERQAAVAHGSRGRLPPDSTLARCRRFFFLSPLFLFLLLTTSTAPTTTPTLRILQQPQPLQNPQTLSPKTPQRHVHPLTPVFVFEPGIQVSSTVAAELLADLLAAAAVVVAGSFAAY